MTAISERKLRLVRESLILPPRPKPTSSVETAPGRGDHFRPGGQPPIKPTDPKPSVPPTPPPTVDWEAKLAKNPAFQALNPGVQQAVLETLANPDIEDAGKEAIATAVTSPGFALLSTDDADDFLQYEGNTIPGFGAQIRAELAAHLASDEYQHPHVSIFPLEQAVGQKRELLEISRGAEALPGSTPVGGLPPSQRDVTVTGPEDVGEYDFETGSADAERYTFHVDGRDVEVIYPKEHPEDSPSPEELEQLFETLPDMAASEYERIIIEPGKTEASASTTGDGQIRIFPETGRSLERLQSTLVHEAAHNVSDDAFGSPSSVDVDDDLSELSPGWQEWAAAAEADGHSVSDYAYDSVAGNNDDDRRKFGEDFAETVELYYQVRGTPAEAEFARLYPNRYDLIRQTFGDA
ncbi:MAG: hypothetical protein IPJ65_27340 [Archangiaceae bacterium]|nr:hypothetical protein [Archangiaceae bacterium]